MGDRKRPKKYPAYPKKEMTPSWKASVLAKLVENEVDGLHPANLAELARSLKADKHGIYKMFEPEQRTSKWVVPICELLDLPLPMVDLSARQEDALDREIKETESLPQEIRDRVATMIRAFLGRSHP